MAHAYTPGLTVTEQTVYRKERRLPLKGHVAVAAGDAVKAKQIVARTELPGAVYPINVAQRLACPPKDVPESVLFGEKQSVKEGAVLARAKSFFGLFTRECTAPVTGTVESVSRVTGQVMLREAPIPVELDAFIDGRVVDVIPDEGVVVEAPAAYIQGIFGIGGEIQGELAMVVRTPDDVLEESLLTPAMAGKVVVGGSMVTFAALHRAIELGIKGIVVGGLDDRDLKEFLGYDLGVAITGNEHKGLTLVVTEGFGRIRMAERTYALLSARAGQQASVCGATQIRAGVQRPEVVIPHPLSSDAGKPAHEKGALEIGGRVRLIREPYFGKIASVTALPVELVAIDTEAKVRVVEVTLGDGAKVLLPRANIELIED